MSERFMIGHDEEPLDIKSWLTLYQGDGPPRTAISCFEPKPNRAKDIRKGDVFLNIGSPRRVLKAPSPPDADGEVLIKVYDIAADETTDFIKDTIEDTMTCTTRHMRYSVRKVPSAEIVPGTLVLQKQEGPIEENPDTIVKLPGGTVGPSLLPFFTKGDRYRTTVKLWMYEVTGKFQLAAFGVGNWDSLG